MQQEGIMLFLTKQWPQICFTEIDETKTSKDCYIFAFYDLHDRQFKFYGNLNIFLTNARLSRMAVNFLYAKFQLP